MDFDGCGAQGMDAELACSSPLQCLSKHYTLVGALVLMVGVPLLWGSVTLMMVGGDEKILNAFMIGLFTDVFGLMMMGIVMALTIATALVRGKPEMVASVYNLWLAGLLIISLSGPMVVVAQMVLG